MSQIPPPGDSVPFASYLPPVRLRPTSVSVIAIIAIVFGSISVIFGLCGVAGTIMNAAGNPFMSMYSTSSSTVTVTGPNGTTTTSTVTTPANPSMAMSQQVNAVNQDPVIIAGNVSECIMYLVLGLIEILAGASLLKLNPAGRRWIIRFAVADILLSIASLIFKILVQQPKMAAAMQGAMQQTGGTSGLGTQMSQFMQVGVYGTDCFLVVLLAWPITILVCMTRANVKAAFLTSPAAS